MLTLGHLLPLPCQPSVRATGEDLGVDVEAAAAAVAADPRGATNCKHCTQCTPPPACSIFPNHASHSCRTPSSSARFRRLWSRRWTSGSSSVRQEASSAATSCQARDCLALCTRRCGKPAADAALHAAICVDTCRAIRAEWQTQQAQCQRSASKAATWKRLRSFLSRRAASHVSVGQVREAQHTHTLPCCGCLFACPLTLPPCPGLPVYVWTQTSLLQCRSEWRSS